MTTVPASGMTSLPHTMGGPAEGDIEAFQAIHARMITPRRMAEPLFLTFSPPVDNSIPLHR